MTDQQKFCSSCGKPLAADARYCASCGTPTDGSGGGAAKAAAAPAPKLALRDILIIAGVLVVVTVGYLIFGGNSQPPAPPQQAQQQSMAGDPHSGTDMSGAMDALKDLPTDYDGLVQVGNKMMDNGNFAVAAECYRRALTIDSSSMDVRTDYGACLHGMGLPQRALEEFKKVLKTDPHHEIVKFNLGVVYSDLGQPDSARYYWQAYVAASPDGPAAQRARELLKQIGG
jgi:cytochrome c-type biogenesis protein CcmH/NrfG